MAEKKMAKKTQTFGDEMRKLTKSAPKRLQDEARTRDAKTVEDICAKCRAEARKAATKTDLRDATFGMSNPPENALLKRIVRRLKKDGLNAKWERGLGWAGVSNIPHVYIRITW